MSAPWEIMHDTWTSKRGCELVRYLRADLTCGECAKCLVAYPEHGHICAYRRYPIGQNDAACMKFQIREEK